MPSIRPGYLIFLQTPPTFLADGLAPANTPTPPAFVGADVSSPASLLLFALVIGVSVT
jgi:hypothetical protein